MSGSPAPLAALLGYDPALLRELSSAEGRDLDSLSQAWLLSCLVLALPAGIAAWLIEHSILLAVVAMAATFLLVLNLLRLVHAGSGTAPELRLKKDFRPSPLPVALLFGLSLIMSQPAQLLHTPDNVREAVEQHRTALIAAHLKVQEAVQETTGADPQSEDVFLRGLQRCQFVVLRLRLLWSSPESTVLWTTLFIGVVLVPAALSRVFWSQALAAYEQARYLRAARMVHTLTRQGNADVERALQHYPTHRPPWPFALASPLKQADVQNPGRQS